MKIILIETSTDLCSVALADNENIIAYKESNAKRMQASLTAPFIKEILDENGLTVDKCDAVCVSMGPGSYTGLRVGVSTAKGLCFGSKLPLLALGTLNILANQAITEGLLPQNCRHIIPLIDARRMEGYTAIFNEKGEQLTDTEPLIIDENSFGPQLEQGPVLFIGDGADKCKTTLTHPNAHFIQCCPKASSMASLAVKEYNTGNFKDIAYFEPFYLKQFIATTSKKDLLAK